jgi:hypothetical protein
MSVIEEIAAERRRQVEVEGWTPEHDDAEHDKGDLACAAASYALHAGDTLNPHSQGDGGFAVDPPPMWPFEYRWWKPKDPRRDLIRAAALIVAEIERMDRRS